MIQQYVDILCNAFGLSSIVEVVAVMISVRYLVDFLKYLYRFVKGVFVS